MSFESIFGITNFSQKENQRFSISIDSFDDVIPVLFLVPETNLFNHYHVRIRKLKELEDLIKGNKVVFKQDHIALEIKNNKIFIYSIEELSTVNDIIELGMDYLNEITTWVNQFKQYSQSELKAKYKNDLKRNVKLRTTKS